MCKNFRPMFSMPLVISVIVFAMSFVPKSRLPKEWTAPIIGCSVLKGDPQLPTDLATIESCIQQAAESGVTNPAAIAITCSPGEEQFVVDFLAALLKSTWASSHTALVAGLQTGITQYKLQFDGGVK